MDCEGPYPRLAYRVGEAAEALGLSRSKTYDLINTGELPSIKLGGCVRVPADGLRDLLARLQGARS